MLAVRLLLSPAGAKRAGGTDGEPVTQPAFAEADAALAGPCHDAIRRQVRQSSAHMRRQAESAEAGTSRAVGDRTVCLTGADDNSYPAVRMRPFTNNIEHESHPDPRLWRARVDAARRRTGTRLRCR